MNKNKSTDVIKEFFEEDHFEDPITLRRRISSYLEICRDLKKLMVDDKKSNLGLSYLTNMSLICTCADMLAKVAVKGKVARGQNGVIFRNYLTEYCTFSEDESKAMWNIRNSTLHAYTVDKIKGIILFGTDRPVSISDKSGKKNIEFNSRRLYKDVVVNSAKKLKKQIKNAPNIEEYEKYLLESGFIYRKNF